MKPFPCKECGVDIRAVPDEERYWCKESPHFICRKCLNQLFRQPCTVCGGTEKPNDAMSFHILLILSHPRRKESFWDWICSPCYVWARDIVPRLCMSIASR